jgi:hypothetical protein
MPYSGGMTQKPTQWSTQWLVGGVPFEVTIELRWLPYGDTRRIDASRVSVHSDTTPVTTKVLHDVPVWSLVQRAIKETMRRDWDLMRLDVPPREYVVFDPASPGSHRLATPEERPGRDAARAEAVAAHRKTLDEPAKAPGGSSGPRKITDDVLREVGTLYAAAVSGNAPQPREYVINRMQTMHPGWEIAPRTASRWIKAARDAGYTKPNQSGKAKS